MSHDLHWWPPFGRDFWQRNGIMFMKHWHQQLDTKTKEGTLTVTSSPKWFGGFGERFWRCPEKLGDKKRDDDFLRNGLVKPFKHFQSYSINFNLLHLFFTSYFGLQHMLGSPLVSGTWSARLEEAGRLLGQFLWFSAWTDQLVSTNWV